MLSKSSISQSVEPIKTNQTKVFVSHLRTISIHAHTRSNINPTDLIQPRVYGQLMEQIISFSRDIYKIQNNIKWMAIRFSSVAWKNRSLHEAESRIDCRKHDFRDKFNHIAHGYWRKTQISLKRWITVHAWGTHYRLENQGQQRTGALAVLTSEIRMKLPLSELNVECV